MNAVKINFVIGILLLSTSSFAIESFHDGFSNDRYSAQSMLDVNLKFTDILSFGVRGAVHGGHQIEHPIGFSEYPFLHSGLTSIEGAAGFKIDIIKISAMAISGGSEMFLRFRKLTDTTGSLPLSDYYEITPAAIVDASIALGERGATAEFLNRFMRRNFRVPDGSPSVFCYNGQMRLTSSEFTPLNISGFGYYEYFIQMDSDPNSGWGVGITLHPLELLKVQGAFTTLWHMRDLNSVVHQAELNFLFDIDLSRGN